MSTNVLCPVCRHPERKHDEFGCTADRGTCYCDAGPRPTVTEPAPVLGSQPLEPVAAPEPLRRWHSWLCEVCDETASTPDTCCGRPLTPVTVTLTRREAA